MTEQTQAISGLSAAIAKATLDVGAFAADKRNTEQNYGYISADAVLERGGQALARVGIAVIPAVTSWDVKFTPRQGRSDRIDALVNFDMTVTLGSEVMHALWAGCGSDYSTPDKALYKAITSGHKYFLMKLLNISVGNEDSEHDNEDSQPAHNPAPRQESKPANVSRPEQAATAPTFVKNDAPATANVSQPTNGNGHEMTVEEAEAIVNSMGVPYGAIDTEKLSHMVNAMVKDGDPAHDIKIKAARMIMAARGEGRKVQQAA